jgi:PPOX class probable F420-dependent enzyme
MDEATLGRFDRESYLSLATRRRDGRMVETPVWFAAHAGRLYVFSELKAGKVKRLRNFPEIRVAACNVRGKVHGPWIDGKGRRIEDSATIEAAYGALHRKYGWQMWIGDFFSRLTGRIGNRAMLELEV